MEQGALALSALLFASSAYLSSVILFPLMTVNNAGGLHADNLFFQRILKMWYFRRP